MTDSEKLELILEKVNCLDTKVSKLERKIDRLEVSQSETKKELYMIDRRIADTYKLALDAWGQGVENRTWLEEESKKAIS